jgi:uncharacterized membrane protein
MGSQQRKLQKKLQITDEFWRILTALGILSAVSIFFLLGRIRTFNSYHYWFMIWNLVLAWLPLLFAWAWLLYIRKNRVLSVIGITLLLLWLGFLPNSFYLITDFIHVRQASQVTVLYDVAMLGSFTATGLILGYVSLALVHMELLKRMRRDYAHAIVGAVLFLCSFAIYLGRFLRWNTWDVLVNPIGILLSFSGQYSQSFVKTEIFSTTVTFFVLLASIYLVCWQLVRAFHDAHTTMTD